MEHGTQLEHGTRPHEQPHPEPLEYVKIAVVLGLITAIEVGFYYIKDVFGALFVPTLLVLSATKFALVVMWYMHLKFDSRLFSALFVGGLLLAAVVLIALMFLFLAFFQ